MKIKKREMLRQIECEAGMVRASLSCIKKHNYEDCRPELRTAMIVNMAEVGLESYDRLEKLIDSFKATLKAEKS